jgi:tetratricopeptide (TPR) repeat protein
MAQMNLQKEEAAKAFNLPEVVQSSRDAAIIQLKRILSKDPKHVDALESLTEIYWDAQDWDNVQEYCGKMLEIDPENTWALHFRAVAGVQRQRFQEAVDDIEKSLAITEKRGREPDPSDYYYLGVAYSMLKNEEGALKAFQKGLEALPGQEDFAYQCSALLIQQRRYGEAVELLRKSLEKNPGSTDLLARLVFALQKDGRNQEAEDLLSKALEESPDDSGLIIRKSSLLAETGRSAEAIALLNEALGKDPENEDLYLQLATIHEKEKKIEGVEDAIRRLLEKNPDSAVALNFLGYTYADMNINLDRAYEMIRHAVDMEPKNAMFLDSLGWVYYRRGEFDKARESLEQAVGLPGGDDPVIFEHLGDVYRALDRTTDALNYWKKALDAAEEKEALSKKIEALEKEKE